MKHSLLHPLRPLLRLSAWAILAAFIVASVYLGFLVDVDELLTTRQIFEAHPYLACAVLSLGFVALLAFLFRNRLANIDAEKDEIAFVPFCGTGKTTLQSDRLKRLRE